MTLSGLLLSLVVASAPDAPCALGGQVVDHRGGPIKGARIEVVGTGAATITDALGRFCFGEALGADVNVLITAERFNPQAAGPFTVGSGTPVALEVTMIPLLTEQVVVEGRADNAVGVASSASVGAISASELASRPVLRSADLLEAVPGVAMTQHSTGGHAPLILLRGYNLDHGTDFATSLEGVPLNLPSHAHAQGYTDLNFLITELIDRVGFEKGPYGAAVGDFSSAGAARIEMKRTIEAPFAVFETGSFSQVRAMSAGGIRAAGGDLLAGVDLSHTDGPSARPDDFRRARGTLRYSRGTQVNGWTASFFGYGSSWFGSDGYPKRAFTDRWIPRYGSLDETDGGRSARYLGAIDRRWSGTSALTTAGGFVQYYDLDLYSTLTFNTVDAALGDQIHQRDRRMTTGAHLSHTRNVAVLGRAAELALGMQTRYDHGRNALFNTVARVPAVKHDDHGNAYPATAYDLSIDELQAGPYVELRVPVTRWLRATTGLRLDAFAFRAATGSGSPVDPQSQAVISPKVSLAMGPWRSTELYANVGRGFHSNHAAGVVLDGATPIVRTLGAEFGVRSAAIPNLQTSVAFWGIDSESELVYVPEAGFTEAGRPGRRYGVEWLNFWRVRPWLTLDADLAFSQARYTADPEGTGTRIPDAVAGVYSLGMTVNDRAGWGGSLRGRYLGPRALTEDGSVESASSFVLNAQLGKSLGQHWQVVVEGFNLLDRRYDDIVYYFSTRLRDPRTGVLEAEERSDFVTHPAEPRSVRVRLQVRF
jgi:hypothetical protein